MTQPWSVSQHPSNSSNSSNSSLSMEVQTPIQAILGSAIRGGHLFSTMNMAMKRSLRVIISHRATPPFSTDKLSNSSIQASIPPRRVAHRISPSSWTLAHPLTYLHRWKTNKKSWDSWRRGRKRYGRKINYSREATTTMKVVRWSRDSLRGGRARGSQRNIISPKDMQGQLRKRTALVMKTTR